MNHNAPKSCTTPLADNSDKWNNQTNDIPPVPVTMHSNPAS